VTISYSANEHDAVGPQRIVLYLAPHLGIVKREVWDGGIRQHEEVLTRYKTNGGT
jgi:hypothetical protein